MLGAFLTTLFFSLSSVTANRSIRTVGATKANLGRLAVAIVCLALWAHVVPLLVPGRGGPGLSGAGLSLFLISGVIGMGIGDLAVFAALPLLGARLSVVMTQCLAVPIAAVAEWLWLGTRLSRNQVACSAVILGGVALALLPSRAHPPRVKVRFSGIVFGLIAALGQGLGAVVSRKAYDATFLAGQTIDGLTATYQRILGGALITVVFFAVRSLVRRSQGAAGIEPPTASGQARSSGEEGWLRWRWTVANALFGAVLGVGCYQWALATTPSGIVLPIVATTPLVVVPLAYWMEGERPTRRSLLGGVVAVIGAVALTQAA